MEIRDEQTYVFADELHRFVREILTKVGVTENDAGIVADVLNAADLRGIDSHGIARLRRYVDGIRHGKIEAHSHTVTLLNGPATVALDACNGLGQPAAVTAMRMAIAKAEEFGIGMVTLRRSNHFGIASYYAMMALEHGMIGIATTNASPQVAPTFGAQAMYGTNPIAVAIPTGGPTPFVLDMATSTVPRGKLERLQREGSTIPQGWAIDGDGFPITNLKELIKGLVERREYALLPLGGMGELFGGHKGFGLGLLVDLLCGPLTGSAWGRHVYGPNGANLGQCFIALRPDCFRMHEEFKQDSEQLLHEIRSARKIQGQEIIYIPGDKEAKEAERRRDMGIPLKNTVLQELDKLANEVGITFLGG
ncbi:malate dehydrogenase [Bacillus thuringiensis]|uniref:Ldh family oxidoreductase n=1 Tax=Bacillus thuringiensis TaxID=1428 RepID=UPI000BFD3A8F|nr:Ldh family oxidoreductase [Bacillus thuringiensis]PGH72157.1 malate dehydrogenase [Bacillus thuringiensis]